MRRSPSELKRQSSIFSATSENTAKFVPYPSYVAPSGYGLPSHTAVVVSMKNLADLICWSGRAPLQALRRDLVATSDSQTHIGFADTCSAHRHAVLRMSDAYHAILTQPAAWTSPERDTYF